MQVKGTDLSLVESAVSLYWLRAMGEQWDAEQAGDAGLAETWKSIKADAYRVLTTVQDAVTAERVTAEAAAALYDDDLTARNESSACNR